jgi:hypothetical protein
MSDRDLEAFSGYSGPEYATSHADLEPHQRAHRQVSGTRSWRSLLVKDIDSSRWLTLRVSPFLCKGRDLPVLRHSDRRCRDDFAGIFQRRFVAIRVDAFNGDGLCRLPCPCG